MACLGYTLKAIGRNKIRLLLARNCDLIFDDALIDVLLLWAMLILGKKHRELAWVRRDQHSVLVIMSILLLEITLLNDSRLSQVRRSPRVLTRAGRGETTMIKDVNYMNVLVVFKAIGTYGLISLYVLKRHPC